MVGYKNKPLGGGRGGFHILSEHLFIVSLSKVDLTLAQANMPYRYFEHDYENLI